MFKQFIALFILLFAVVNAQAAIDSTWLVSQQNPDGSFNAQNDIAYQVQNTSEALQTLYELGDISQIDENLALQIIDVSDSSHLENVVRKIVANKNANLDVSVLVSQLKLFINSDGGFGSIVGYQSTILETALAVQILAVSGGLLDDDFNYAVSYLINRQNTDGSWSSAGNVSSVYITATVSLALQKAQAVFNVSDKINSANIFLANYVQNNIADVETFEIALAILSIAPTTSDKTIYQPLLDRLQITRDVDGSWAQDTYTTALAMRALYIGEQVVPVNEDLSSVVNPGSGISAVTGVITENLTGQVLVGVSVSISTADGANVSTTTDVDGRYTISNLFPGSASVSVDLAGYHTISSTPVLSAGVIYRFNLALVRQPAPVPVDIIGSVVDVDNGSPLTGANIQIVNRGVGVLTDAGGDFLINNLSPGSISMLVSKAGYISRSYTISVTSGGIVNLGLVTLTSGSATNDFSTLTGIITDAISAQPLNGVAISLSGADNQSAFSDVNGRFTISNVRPGDSNITAALAGYIKAVSSINITTGINVEFNAFLVKSDNQAQVTVQGNVVDNETLLPLSGAEIQVIGQSQLVQTNTNGEFQIGGITSGSLKIVISRVDYQNITYNIVAGKGGLVNLGQIRLSTKASTSVLGKIVTVNVPGTSNMWLAGMPDGTTSGGDSAPAHSPVLVNGADFGAGFLTFSNVSGGVNDEPGCLPDTGSGCSIPDGSAFFNHFPGAMNGMSDVRAPINALIGVFLDDSQPASSPAPATLNFQTIGTNFVSLSPELKQVFFIGDGLTGSSNGEIQKFVIPQGTTRLYLGTMDDYGWYNNSGALNADIVIKSGEVDLTAAAFNVDKVSTNLQTLQVSGSAGVNIKNTGLTPVETPTLVTVFEDSNANKLYDVDVDNVLGETTVFVGLAKDNAFDVDVPLSGVVAFRDSPIYVMVDSDAQIIESNETNNVNASSKQCSAPVSTPAQLVLQEKWYWDGSQSGIGNAAANVFGPVMVAQLNDDNGDSLINAQDTPDAVFVSYANRFDFGVLRAISGADGQELWSTSSNQPSLRGSVAIGDIDNDGFVEIISIRADRSELLAFEHTGELKWAKPTKLNGGSWDGLNLGRAWDGVALADLNHDGQVEIINGNRVFDSNGDLLWEGNRDNGGISYGHLSIAANIDNTGDMEVIAGRTVYDSTGSVVWHQSRIPDDGFNAVGNFDADDFAEIVLVAKGQVYLLDNTGEIIWGPVALPGGGNGGAPTVADFDGDGQPEIGVAGSSRYVVFETDGTVKWQNPTRDASSNQTGSSLFDFEADGKAEILYADEINLYIYDGATGDVRLTIPNGSLTTFEYPVIVDIDNDGQAEIVVAANTTSGRNGVRVYESAQGTWAPTRSIWNQHSYHINNINDDGSIPKNEEASWLTHNSYRLNTFAKGGAAAFADVTASLLKISDVANQQPSISVRIGNGGELSVTQAININFYEGDPDIDGVLLGTVTINGLASGAYQDVLLDNMPALAGGKDIVVVADANDSVTECNELNNTVSLPVFAGSSSADLVVSTDSTKYIVGTQIPLQGIVNNTSAVPGQFIVQLQVEDAQGNIIQTFAQQNTNLLAGQAATNINNIWNSARMLTGVYQLRGQLSDLNNTVLSSNTMLFSLTSAAAQTTGQTITALRTNTDKLVYHTSDRVRIDNLISNNSTDSIINNAQLRIYISNTSNVIVFTQTVLIPTLTASSRLQQGINYSFTGETEGNYTVSAQLLTQQNVVLSSAQASYIVKSDVTKSIAAQVSVQSADLYIGQPQVCIDKLQNTGKLDLASLTVQQTLIDVSANQILQTQNQTLDLATGASQTLIRNINTASLATGDYICAVQVNIDGTLRTLDFSAFKMTVPPVSAEGDLRLGSRGQLLVWFDAQSDVDDEQHENNEDGDGESDDESHDGESQHHAEHHDSSDNSQNNNSQDAQRQYLKTLLDEGGWAYALVDNRNDFINEFSSGQYQAYLLINRKEKPGQLLEKALREAVYQGEGLVVTSRNNKEHGESWSSDHGQHNALAEALGIRVHEHLNNVQSFNFAADNALSLDGTITFDETKQVLGLELKQAQTILEYEQQEPPHNNDGDDHESGHSDDDNDHGSHQPEPASNNTAVSFNQYGQGRALYAGFDVLAYAEQYQDDSLLQDLIKQALLKTHPPAPLLLPSVVLPIDVTIQNTGSDAIVQASLTASEPVFWSGAPDGIIVNPVVTWQYPALAGSERELTAWLQLPASGGDIAITLLTRAGLDEVILIDQNTATQTISVTTPVTLNSIITRIEDLQAQGYQQKTLEKALKKLNKALTYENEDKLSHASKEAIKATDKLKQETDSAIIDVRLQIDEWLRLAFLRSQGSLFLDGD